MEVTKLIEEVRKRQVIWDASCRDHSDRHKMAAAWRQICTISWPEFDTLPADQKRTRCLQLQKKWRDTKGTFIKDLQKQKLAPSTDQKLCDQLAFLIPVIENPDGQTSTKRRRTETGERDEPVASSTSTRSGSEESRDRDAEEDRLFLLSLVSFMQDVPRTSKLALRADMIKLIGKYSTSPPN